MQLRSLDCLRGSGISNPAANHTHDNLWLLFEYLEQPDRCMTRHTLTLLPGLHRFGRDVQGGGAGSVTLRSDKAPLLY